VRKKDTRPAAAITTGIIPGASGEILKIGLELVYPTQLVGGRFSSRGDKEICAPWKGWPAEAKSCLFKVLQK
jgi:hypothetical protein